MCLSLRFDSLGRSSFFDVGRFPGAHDTRRDSVTRKLLPRETQPEKCSLNEPLRGIRLDVRLRSPICWWAPDFGIGGALSMCGETRVYDGWPRDPCKPPRQQTPPEA